ncbi:MAG: cytochrome c [Longimicrobiales bacterium]|nr:cytochrome c [Longimicrobiales bacterium]
MRFRMLLAAGALAGAACGHEFEPPDRQARVLEAERHYSDAAFDTVVWENDSVRSAEGNAVYAEKCRLCHGPMGEGQTEYARERGLEIPSLIEDDWAYASSLDELRHRIFVGHEAGMPVFGSTGLMPREIDGSAFYVLYTLRPDVLATPPGGGG